MPGLRKSASSSPIDVDTVNTLPTLSPYKSPNTILSLPQSQQQSHPQLTSPLHLAQYSPSSYITPYVQRNVTAPNTSVSHVVDDIQVDTLRLPTAATPANNRSLWFSPAEMALPSSTGYNVTKVVFRAPPILTEAIVPTEHIYYDSVQHEFVLPLTINNENTSHINYPYESMKLPSRASSTVNSSTVHLNPHGHKALTHTAHSTRQLSTELFSGSNNCDDNTDDEYNDSKQIESHVTTSSSSDDSGEHDVSSHIALYNGNGDSQQAIYDNSMQPIDDVPLDEIPPLSEQPSLIIPLSCIAGLEFNLSLDSASAAPAQLTIAVRHDMLAQSRIQSTSAHISDIPAVTQTVTHTPPSKFRVVRAFDSLRRTWRTGVNTYQHKPYLRQLPPICFTAVTYPAITSTLITMIICFVMHIWLLGIVCCIACTSLICLHMYRVRNIYYLESNLDQQREQCYYITFYFVLEQLMDFVYLRQFMLSANPKTPHTVITANKTTHVRFSQMPLFLDNVYVDYACHLLLPPVAYHSPRLRRFSRLILPVLYLYQAFDALFSSLLPSLFNVFLSIMPYCRAEWLAVLNIFVSLMQPLISLLQYTLVPQLTIIITTLATLSRRAIVVLQAVIIPIRYMQASLYWFGAGLTQMLSPLLQLTDVFKSVFQSILHPMHTLTNTFNKTILAVNAIVAPVISAAVQSGTLLLEVASNAGRVLLTPFQAVYILMSQSLLPKLSQSVTAMAAASMQAKTAAKATNQTTSGFSSFSKSVGVRIVRVAVAMSNRFVMFFNKGKAQYNERQHQANLQAELKKTQLQQQLYLNRVELQNALVAAGHANAAKSVSTSPANGYGSSDNRRHSLPAQQAPNDLRQRRMKGRKNANLSFDISGVQSDFGAMLSPVDDHDDAASEAAFEQLSGYRRTDSVDTPLSSSLPATPVNQQRQSLRNRTRTINNELRSQSATRRHASPSPARYGVPTQPIPASPSALPSSRRNAHYSNVLRPAADSAPVSPSASPRMTHVRSHTTLQVNNLLDADNFVRPFAVVKKSPSSHSTPSVHVSTSPSISAKSHHSTLAPVADLELIDVGVPLNDTAAHHDRDSGSETSWSQLVSDHSDSSDSIATNIAAVSLPAPHHSNLQT